MSTGTPKPGHASWSRILAQPPLGWWLLLASGLSLGLALLVDLSALIYVHDNTNGTLDRVFRAITALGDATPYVVVLLGTMLVLWHRYRRTDQVETQLEIANHLRRCWFILLSMAASGAVHHLIKFALGRARPRLWFNEQFYGLQPFNLEFAQNGFPSGHTQTVWSLAVALCLVYPRFAPVYLTLAVLVGISRVMLQAHYPSDVLFGAYVGAACAILLKRHYLDPRLNRGGRKT